MAETKYTLYKIFYRTQQGGEYLAYLGRTKQRINARLRGHFFKTPITKLLNLSLVSRIETVECKTEADMFLYEIYYINKYKPALNRDDKAPDDLTFALPELQFQEYTTPLLDKWREQIKSKKEAEERQRKERLEDFWSQVKA